VIKNLTLKVEPGMKLGVVGRTGAGKSTLGLTLSRLIELDSGAILIDGVDISKVDLKTLRSIVTVIPQDPTLFTGTLRFNIDPIGKASDDQIVDLLKRAGLDDLLSRSVGGSSGLDMAVSEGGSNLSVGEKQLICICRAVLRKNKVVILDEATANIDVITEQKILTLIHKEFEHASVITIAHRLNTIIRSDKIAVMSHGELAEFDTPQALMDRPDSEFSKLLKEL
jgi:ATP-binding cassette, subfamily C (CFTR/MRP), member 1